MGASEVSEPDGGRNPDKPLHGSSGLSLAEFGGSREDGARTTSRCKLVPGPAADCEYRIRNGPVRRCARDDDWMKTSRWATHFSRWRRDTRVCLSSDILSVEDDLEEVSNL